ncbi:MAG: NAD(P)/FAD-dependent oxidoreductase [Planctomycetota bacterium]|nr:MAG: NAD(P)/FAD-dependent oxidoreductase [Planctomycetota bacterium]
MATTCDLAVIGAGFAGLTCAQAAAVRGLNTVVLERKPEVGAACHTTGILVREVADAWDIPRNLTRRIHGVRLYGPSLAWIDLCSSGYFFLATDTPKLMRHLAELATASGAKLRLGAGYVGCERIADGFRVAGHNLSARYLAAADGARSRVASDLKLGANRKFLVGAEVELVGVRGLDEDRLHVFLDSRLARGYIAWAVPGVGVTQVGLATRGPIAGRMDALLDRLAGLFDLSRARVVARRGGLIPCGGPVLPWRTDRAMLLGDAAGMVSPLTAGGIHPAMQLGRVAGVAIANHLLDGGPDPSRAVAALAPTFACKRWLRTAFDLLPTNFLFDQLLASATFRRLAQVIFFHHRGLFSLEAWREILLAAR